VRIVVTGATGLIGSAVVARLAADGHTTVACVRTPGRRPLAAHEVAVADLATATESDWQAIVARADAVVNCAGVLQDSPRDSTDAAHASGPARLFAACERAGTRRVIHFSAMGVDRGALSSFSRSKLAGDEALMSTGLDWVILRPSVVVGRPAYGGSALFRGLAALPVLPTMPETGALQVVQLDDVVETVRRLLQPGAPSRVALEVAGPERLSMPAVVESYRQWFGWPKQRRLPLPRWLAGLFYGAGDVAGLLGWRPPMRSTAQAEIVRGAVGDTQAWSKATGIVPRGLRDALALEPPSVQERWFARLYFLKPLIIGVLALFWFTTGVVALGPGWEFGMSLMRDGGAGAWGPAIIVAGALADIAIGLGIAWRRTTRLALWTAIAISLTYAVVGTYMLPRLWADPLGPMLKIWPIIVLIMVALAVEDDR
jgi:uncharacterized protein YbjT (DUF2867 family)